MDFKQLKNIQTPDIWISDTLKSAATAKKRTHPKLSIIITLLVIATALTITAAGVAIPSFYQWLRGQFEPKTKITELLGYEVTEDGFFVKNGIVSYFDGENLKELTPDKVSGSLTYHEKAYTFSFDYVIKDGKIHVTDKSDSVVSVCSFNKDSAIVWLDAGNLWNSYYVELETGNLTPIVDHGDYTTTDGKLKLATDVRVSPGRSYLLYRSNRDTKKTDGNKGEWFLQSTATGQEIKLDKAPGELFTNEIGFIDDSHLSIAYGENLKPVIFDCKTQSYIELDTTGGEFANTLISSKGYDNGKYVFYDNYTGKTYSVCSGHTDNAVVVTRELICLLAPDGSADIYLIRHDKSVHFKSEQFLGDIKLTDVKAIDTDNFVFITSQGSYIVSIG